MPTTRRARPLHYRKLLSGLVSFVSVQLERLRIGIYTYCINIVSIRAVVTCYTGTLQHVLQHMFV